MGTGYHRHMNASSFILGLALLVGASAAVAKPTVCVPVIEKAWIRAAPPSATTLAGYAIVRNPCSRAFAVTDVASADFAMAMIHQTLVENGISRMRPTSSLALPARGALVFSPGGAHMMLMHPRRVLTQGDRVKLVLSLAGGEKIAATAIVQREPPAKP